MSLQGKTNPAGIIRWLADRPSVLLLTAPEDRLLAAEPQTFTHAWAGVMVLSILWGAVFAVVWNLADGWFVRSTEIWYAPTALVLAIMFLGPFRRSLVSWGQLTGRADPRDGQLVIGLTLFVFALVILAAKPWSVMPGAEPALPFWLEWIRPDKEGARVLLLMPVWGSWGMLIVGQLWRCSDRTEKPVAAMMRGCGPITAVGSLLLPLCGTWFMFSFLGSWQHLVMSAFAVLSAIAAGVILCWRCGGLSRAALLSVNLIVQLAFVFGSLYGRVRS